MKIITKEQVLNNLDFYIDEIKQGKIFIFPTDTVYGIGCDAYYSEAIEKIRLAKKRDNKPLAIIAPSLEWIRNNYIINSWAEEYLKKLPGKYTFILEFKKNSHISPEVNLYDNENGIRIPKIWFAEIITKLNSAFIATSVNISGEPHIQKLEDLDKDIEKFVDYFIDEGKLTGKPSTIINLRTKECKVLR